MKILLGSIGGCKMVIFECYTFFTMHYLIFISKEDIFFKYLLTLKYNLYKKARKMINYFLEKWLCISKFQLWTSNFCWFVSLCWCFGVLVSLHTHRFWYLWHYYSHFEIQIVSSLTSESFSSWLLCPLETTLSHLWLFAYLWPK